MPALTSKQMTKLSRLKELGSGVRVDRVLGRRVLVKTIVPRTEADAIEERGLLVIPDSIKAEYVPMPITGIILGIGDELQRTKSHQAQLWTGFIVCALSASMGSLNILVGHDKTISIAWFLISLLGLLMVFGATWRIQKERLKEGDMIMFSRVSGLEFTINSQDLRIIHVNDILSVLVDTDESVVEVKSIP